MKKCSQRRSMTYAMLCYARMGATQGCKTPFDVCKRIEGTYGSNAELALDIWAVHESLMVLSVAGDTETVRALKEIYFKPFEKDLRVRVTRNEITDRVLRFAYENHLDQRTVYRRLRKARDLWYSIRQYGE